jgi:hypothetical protein
MKRYPADTQVSSDASSLPRFNSTGYRDLLLRSRVHFQQVDDRLPSGDRLAVADAAQVPQRDERAAELLMLVEDEVRDVGVAERGHSTSNSAGMQSGLTGELSYSSSR